MPYLAETSSSHWKILTWFMVTLFCCSASSHIRVSQLDFPNHFHTDPAVTLLFLEREASWESDQKRHICGHFVRVQNLSSLFSSLHTDQTEASSTVFSLIRNAPPKILNVDNLKSISLQMFICCRMSAFIAQSMCASQIPCASPPPPNILLVQHLPSNPVIWKPLI